MHKIRLRGPWSFRTLFGDASEDDLQASDSEGFPIEGDWPLELPAVGPGRQELVRRFNRPTGLHEEMRVWLVVDVLAVPAEVFLNGEPLGRAEPKGKLRRDILPRLQDRNWVRIVLDGDSESLAGLRDVRLEIEE